MRLIFKVLPVILVGIALCSSTASAQSPWYYHVRIGGTGGKPVQNEGDPGLTNCWSNINAAFTAVKSRTTPGPWIIQVDDEGTYDEAVALTDFETSSVETLTLTKAPWLAGRPTIFPSQAGKRAIVINGLGPGSSTPLPGQPGQPSRRVTFVTVRGFTLKNNAQGTDRTTEQPVFTDNQNYLTEGLHIIEGCQFDGQGQVYDAYAPIFTVGTCVNTIFRGNVFKNFNINETNILGVVFVLTKPLPTATAEAQIILVDNVFHKNHGLVFEAVGDKNISKCYQLIFERNQLLHNSSFHHGTVSLLDLSVIFRNNILAGNAGGTGRGSLCLYHAGHVKIYHNTFFNNHLFRELLVNKGPVAGVEIKNNLFWPSPGCLGIQVEPGCTENLMTANNAFYTAFQSKGHPPGSGFNATENTEVVGSWNRVPLTAYAWNNISANNTGNGYALGGVGLDNQLHLKAGSLCIDHGVAGLVSDDFEGGRRPAGAGYDIGAVEYGTKAPARSLYESMEAELEGKRPSTNIPVAVQPEPPSEPEGDASTPKAGQVMTNSIGMRLAWVPAGLFMMGSPLSEPERSLDEIHHRVRISPGFWMGVCEVTQLEYQKVMGNNPSKSKGDALPVETVSWENAQQFCRKLGLQEGMAYRLPTEAEWEYACRGGDMNPLAIKVEDLAWHEKNADRRTHQVGQKHPNSLGLYDMLGNVFEWCQDWFSESFYGSSPENNPQGPNHGTDRVIRGGCYLMGSEACRSAFRGCAQPNDRSSIIGFRVILAKTQRTNTAAQKAWYYHVKTTGSGGKPTQSEADPGLSNCWNSINAAFSAVRNHATPGPWIIQVDDEATYDEAVILADLQTSINETLTLTKAP